MPYPHLVTLAALVLLAAAPAWAVDGGSGCLGCHGDRQRMQELGYPHFTVTQEEVAAQTGMPASCEECHLGNPRATTTAAAHKGLARLQVVRKKGLTADHTTPRPYPLAYGTNPTNRLYVAVQRDGQVTRDASVAALQWQDKNDQLTQNYPEMEQTCGRCHPRELAQFRTSAMGTNAKQSQYAGWISPRGPHNCGPWFAGNLERLQANTGLPIPPASAAVNQRACNTCHVGCLDCHFTPQPKQPKNPAIGAHTFSKTPPALSCYGNGRASICHAGPEDRRRGAGYFGGSFAFPEGGQPDVHLQAKVGCLDCHESTRTNPRLGHGTVLRQAEGSCIRCHRREVEGHNASLHKRLTCEACHIQQVGGYQGTYWGPGRLAGIATPFFKYMAYYGIMPEPILIRDQRGRWIPVKPFPMAAMNQEGAPFTPGLHWRFPASLPAGERTDDAWAYTGLYGGMPDNNKALTWIQLDKLSHKLGPARSCDSCHGDLLHGSQIQKVTWEYSDAGADPFKGGHTVMATRTSLKIKNIRATEQIILEPGAQLSSFAPWAYLDVWEIAGDFSIPVPRDTKAYATIKADPARARAAKIIH